MKTTTPAVYLTQAQCALFGIAYYGPGEGRVSAAHLLSSKGGDGYDEKHREFLEPLGDQLLHLRRAEGDENSPGWFSVVDDDVQPN